MSLTDRVKDALRSVFGRERDEREMADSPSAEIQGSVRPATYGVMGTTQVSGMLSVSDQLMDRYADYECVTGDTPVLTLEGPVEIKELAARCAADPDYKVQVFTWDQVNGRVTVGDGSAARLTKNDVVYEVELDNGFVFRATADHPIMLRDGTYAPVKDIGARLAEPGFASGVSVMPLYMRENKYGGAIYQENERWHIGAHTAIDKQRWRPVARMVAEAQMGERLPANTIVKHKDSNVRNLSPSNLSVTYREEKPRRSGGRKSSILPSLIESAREFVSDNRGLVRGSQSLRRKEGLERLYNHKIVRVTRESREDVYDLSVYPTRNFAIGTKFGGVFIHNSMNDYPEVNCLAEGTKVYVKEGGVATPTPIQDLVGRSVSVLAYDRASSRLKFVDAVEPRLSGNDAEVLELAFSSGRALLVTPDHMLLTVGAGYLKAKDLRKGAQVVSTTPGTGIDAPFVLVDPSSGVATLSEDPRPAGKANVYDITTETHNFVAEGIVVHNSAYHYFANDSTQPNMDHGKTVWVESPDAAIKSTANSLLHHRLRIDDDIFSLAYTLCMYGNDMEEVLVTDNGVVGLNFLPPPTMRRIERTDGALIGYIQDLSGQFPTNMPQLRKMLDSPNGVPKHVAMFEDWQVLHFRLRGSYRRSPYGYSVAEGARWIWKRLLILEDSVIIYKLSRAPSRYAFYIDVTDVPPDRVKGFLKRAKDDLKKKKMVDPSTGQLQMRHNPLANDEDFFLASRDGKDLARVDVLSGPDYQAVEDVNYFLRKLYGVLKVPRSYMGQDDAVPGRAILSNEDVRAARVTMGVQREMRLGIERLIRIDMAARGMSNIWQPEFQVMMTAPSAIYSLAAMEWKNAQADFASRMMGFTSLRWVQENVFKFTGEEIAAIERQVRREQEIQAMPPPGVDPSQVPAQEGGVPVGLTITPDDIPRGPLLERNRDDIPTRRQLVKMIDDIRRKEDLRDRESRKRHDELLERVDLLAAKDKKFERRLDHYGKFGSDVRNGVLPRVNGHLNPAPVARKVNRNGST